MDLKKESRVVAAELALRWNNPLGDGLPAVSAEREAEMTTTRRVARRPKQARPSLGTGWESTWLQ
jgi:hypothetical protein